MSQAEAIARAQVLRESLLDHGVRAVSIELVEGRGSGGWSDDRFVGSMGHHIVSYRAQGLTPGLNLVKRGRSDLPGPLCNGYGGFDEVARIICMGWANHPGAGGPYRVPSGTVPQNNGRPYWFGWEHEGGLYLADWTDSFREFMGRCHAGTLAWLRLDERSHIEHKTWAPTRKVDRLGYTLATARAELEPHLTPVLEEDDMFQYVNIDEDLVRRASAAGWYKRADGSPDYSESTIQYFLDNLAELQKGAQSAVQADFGADWLNWRRAVANGMARGGARGPKGDKGDRGPKGESGAPGDGGVDETRVRELISGTRLHPS